jgi:amino acid permease
LVIQGRLVMFLAGLSTLGLNSSSQGLGNFRNGQAFSGFSEFAQTFLFAFFSYGGVELVALAAGESKEPHKSVPRAIKATFFRIMLFYVLTVLVLGLCINRNEPSLAYGMPQIPSPELSTN